MKTYVKFENNGEIDVNAFRLLGASTKETDDNKIGFWGSGLKYSLAVLLRNGVKIKVFAGEKEIKIGKRKTKMRGEEFEVITINGTPTSITTRMGKDWELWFAIREIYANTIDEGNKKIDVSDSTDGEAGVTKIFVEMTDEIKDIFDNFDQYFSYSIEPDFELGQDKVFDNDEGLIYRRGIKVGEFGAKSLYSYDIHDVQINESRVIPSSFDLDIKLCKLWKEEAEVKMINTLINTQNSYEKNRMDWDWSGTFNSNWLEVLKERTIIPEEATGFYVEEMSKPHIILPSTMCSSLYNAFGEALNIKGFNNKGDATHHKEIELSEMERERINKSKEIVAKHFPAISRMEVIVAKLSTDVMGTIIGDKIVLNENLLSRSDDNILETIIEEFIHISSGHEDRTRGFQDYAISMITTLIK